MKRKIALVVAVAMSLLVDTSKVVAEPGYIGTCSGIGCPGAYWNCRSYSFDGGQTWHDCYINAVA